jgi:toxin-antitoxin system PIN domain toxin
MRIELPDVNVLLALLDPMHPHHEAANIWYTGTASTGWATCPLTENGFVRILSSPSYLGLQLRVEDALALLEATTANPIAPHHFWADSLSLRNSAILFSSAITGTKQITDVYLLALCQQNGGTFVTLDSAITTAAIVSPHPDLYRIL